MARGLLRKAGQSYARSLRRPILERLLNYMSLMKEMSHGVLARRQFLKASAIAGLSASLPAFSANGALAAPPSGIDAETGNDALRSRPKGQKAVHDLATKPIERVRIGVIGLRRGLMHVKCALGIEFAEVVAVCDVFEARATTAAEMCERERGKRPAVYSGTEHVWEQLVDRDDIDIIYVATPFAWHVPMALRAMERGKHAFVEVPAAITVDDCWLLVNASERTQRHCVMLENCCYGENELFVLNLVRAGVFGHLHHAECAYIHDLRELLFKLESEGDWRRDYYTKLNGNLYPTHGLGPVAQYLGIDRGDRCEFIVSMSSVESGLTQYRNVKRPNGNRHSEEVYVCADMNTSLIKTKLGRTIMVQHDVVSPRPYNRINALSGTGGTFCDYPARLALNDPRAHGLQSDGAHAWLGEKDMARMREKFTHPLWRNLGERAKGSGHGGMDFVMNWRHLQCVHEGWTPDSVVYDAATWSSVFELSTRSVAKLSMPQTFPDFTRGLWRSIKPLAIASA